MWWLYVVSSLLLPGLAEGAVCDDGQLNIQFDLPDKRVYMCNGHYLHFQNLQMLPSIATRYKQENSYHACMDVDIEYTAPIPNSGGHRPIWAKYGEYFYCPPQRWVHNLQHGGVAFLYHPCVHPRLKQALSLLARSCVSRHIITPLPTLSRERPLALVAWCSTFEMSRINVTEIRDWLRENVPHKQQYEPDGEATYQHLLIRASTMTSADKDICSHRILQVLNYFPKQGVRLKRHLLQKRSRAYDVALSNVSINPFSATPSVLSTEPVPEIPANVSHPAVSGAPAPQNLGYNGQIPSLKSAITGKISPLNPAVAGDIAFSKPLSPAAPDYSPKDPDTGGSKAVIHSRELGENGKTLMPELPVETTIPSAGNMSQSSLGISLAHFIGKNSSEEMDQKKLSTKDALIQQTSPESQQNKQPTSHAATMKTPDKPADQNLVSTTAAKPPAQSNEQKPECSCLQDSTPESPAKVMKRLGAGRQKNSVFLSTPRTEEATWAAASLIFLLALLTFAVLYTQLYKKFRKSQSLYWASESHNEETETVASIIKRRLVQGHSKRKKWFGRKKSPVRLYESLSDSSD